MTWKVIRTVPSVTIPQLPYRSGIVLSELGPGQEDGILQMGEIFSLNLDAELVVLSACKSALGKLVRGEGMVGLTRAFIYAGSRRMVVSLWNVNDPATADFMNMFYGHLAAGTLPARALRKAKVAMLKSDIPAYHHPYFWAPFVQVGLF